MSSRTLRHTLAGLLTVAFLALGAPAASETTDLPAPAETSSFWASTWQWLVEQIGLTPPAPDVTAAAKRDAGWILDPDG